MAPDDLRPDLNQDAATREPRTGFGRGFLLDCWWFAAASSALKPGKLHRYELLGEPVLLGRSRQGAVFAMRDVCPHRAAPLSAGKLDERDGEPTVECPYHGWRFGLDGGCRAIPSLLETQDFDPARIRVRSYPVRESQGMVWVWMPSDPRAPAEPDHEPPQIDGAVGGPPKLVVHMDFDSHIDHAVVGLMDPIHVPYIHNQWWWRSAKKQHEKAKAFAPRPFGFAMTRHKPSSNSRAYRLLGGAPETEITFRLPGQRWEHVRYGQRTFMTLTCMTPLDERRTRMTQLFWSDLPLFGLLKPLVRRAAKTFLSQDVGILGLQSEGLRYDPGLLWIEDADTQAKWYGQLKREWTAHRREGREFRNPVPETVLRWRS